MRGRGRGKYICEECGIRCKKPSMLKKHIRTHTDVRPYVCKFCNFAFKTKGGFPFSFMFSNTCKCPQKIFKKNDIDRISVLYNNYVYLFSGNLTKHMKSKAHMKKCLELGVSVSSVDEAEVEETGMFITRLQDPHYQRGTMKPFWNH